jgi:parallel beta-helix repeat protein
MIARKKIAVSAVLYLTACLFRAGAAVYYVDSETGDDAHDGSTPAQAWKSLAPANAHVFDPGDKLLLKAGTHYTGQLKPQGSGKSTVGSPLPVQLGMFGEGAKPRIDGNGEFRATLLLRNVEYWDVQDLEITNLGTNRAPSRTGVHVVTDGFGTMRHIHLRRLYVHDVNSDLRKEHEGCGIFFESRGGDASHFDDFLVEDCHVVRADRNGICQRTSGRARSTNVVIRGNLLEDIGGDGIKLWGSNGGLIESNTVRGGRTRCDDYAAGIWPFDCDDTIIQYNEVSGMKGDKDGQGFDSDYLCRRSLFQYNYSHDNEGGFMLICAPGNSYNRDTIIRYNISQNDGINSARVFHFGGGATNTWIYNNTIYVGPKQDLPLLKFTTWSGGNATETHFINNIFYIDGRVTYDWGQSTNNIFANNAFYGNHTAPPNDPHSTTRRPPLLAPGTGGQGFASLTGYTLAPDPKFPHGQIIPNIRVRDFFGDPIPKNLPPSLGAYEFKNP